MTLLQNKVAIITGASSGIGRAAAKLFAAEGAQVIVGARREAELNSLVAEIQDQGGQAKALAGDVVSEDYNKELVSLAVSEFGKLDIAFNNAGTLGKLAPIADLSLADWGHTLATNLTSGFLGAKYQIPAMVENGGGSLLFTSSVAGVTISMPTKSAYAAAKAGLIGLTKTLACEYGPKGIRVNALVPGAVATPMADELGTDPEFISFLEGLHALKRRAEPTEIAQTALYLASDAASFVTGTAHIVDGGVSICKT